MHEERGSCACIGVVGHEERGSCACIGVVVHEERGSRACIEVVVRVESDYARKTIHLPLSPISTQIFK